MNDNQLPQNQSFVQPSNSYIDDYTPPADTSAAPILGSLPEMAQAPAAPSAAPTSSQEKSESIQDQNVFFMLGVTDGTPEEREEFLDELQQVIWEDFLENDVDLLLTEDERMQLEELKTKPDQSDLQKQEAMIVYLEKLIPDLEDIMLEKALELKEDMFKERISGMREYFAGQQDKLDLITQAEKEAGEEKWFTSTTLLNTLKS